MKREDVLRVLDALADGELHSSEVQASRQVMERDPVLAAEVEAYIEFTQIVKRSYMETPPTGDEAACREAILHTLREAEASNRASSWGTAVKIIRSPRWAVAALCVLAAGVAGSQVGHYRQQTRLVSEVVMGGAQRHDYVRDHQRCRAMTDKQASIPDAALLPFLGDEGRALEEMKQLRAEGYSFQRARVCMLGGRIAMAHFVYQRPCGDDVSIYLAYEAQGPPLDCLRKAGAAPAVVCGAADCRLLGGYLGPMRLIVIGKCEGTKLEKVYRTAASRLDSLFTPRTAAAAGASTAFMKRVAVTKK